MLASEEEEDNGRLWRPRRRRTEVDAGIQGGGRSRTLTSEEEEDDGRRWRPTRRRREVNAGI